MRRLPEHLLPLFLLLIVLGFLTSCNEADANNPTPYEFTLILSSSNNGEVGPCG